MKKQTSGVFDVVMTPEPGEFPASRRLDKRYHGELDARGEGRMLSFVSPVEGSAAYVALERVTGTLAGRAGSFVLQHSGLMNRGVPTLSIVVVPDSGTGALQGLAGRMGIRIEADGRHGYELEYELEHEPENPLEAKP
ncbi:hypothetical protein CKO44_03030 [Rubrivivax gelatinosus]|uniref:DUF3224 domain-containing protein n=1 Tax=Rubrivivax gelatinosus TaxID=28068 RepID=UPI0019070D82|nr:DUF3224 domain-containing protein [Rubrivivax gelatinosus]MBK1612438.1 hypothetical protein [Rubrivivax gelatinosus]